MKVAYARIYLGSGLAFVQRDTLIRVEQVAENLVEATMDLREFFCSV